MRCLCALSHARAQEEVEGKERDRDRGREGAQLTRIGQMPGRANKKEGRERRGGGGERERETKLVRFMEHAEVKKCSVWRERTRAIFLLHGLVSIIGMCEQ